MKAISSSSRKLIWRLFLFLLFLFLLKLNYSPDFRQNFPIYKAGRFILPSLFSSRGIGSISFPLFLLFIFSVLISLAFGITDFRQTFREIFFRDKKAVAGLICLILTLIPDSDICYRLVGFLLNSLVLFCILLYFLHPVLVKSASFLLKVKEITLSISNRKLVGGIFLLVFLTTNILSYKIFQHYPHIYDSTAQLFQAKIFLQGSLSVEALRPTKFFSYNNVILDVDGRGRWYSQYPPGHPFLLFLGLLINAPWLINPFFGALSVIALYFLGRELYDEATGRLCLLLAAVSPFLLFMSSEYMSHTTATFFLILGFYWGVRADKITPSDPIPIQEKKTVLYAPFLSGAALGMAHLIRPFSAFVVSFPLVATLILRWAKQRKRREIRLLLISLALFAGILMTYNTLTNGHPFLFGYKVLHKSKIGLGFGYTIDRFPPHTPRLGLRYTLQNLNELNIYLFQWPIPSLAFVAVLLGSGHIRKEDKLMLVCMISLLGGYFFYGFQHLSLGPRFMYEGIFLLILLTARGIFFVRDILGRKREGILWGGLAVCVLVGMLHMRSLAFHYSNEYWGFNPTLLEKIQRKKLENALVFSPYYHLLFAGMEPNPKTEVIFARDLGEEENRELIRLYPGRTLYRTSFFNLHPYYPYQRIDPSRHYR